ncbi:MAG: hypothetical protein AAFP22_23320, partial [Planctomycetota bacterium]
PFVAFVQEALGHWNAMGWEYLAAKRLLVTPTPETRAIELDERTLRVVEVYDYAGSRWHLRVLPKAEFHRLDAQRYASTARRYATVDDLPSETEGRRGEPTPHLVLPRDHGIAEELAIVYDAGAIRPGEDADTIDVPPRLEPALLMLMRAYVRGRFDLDSGGVEAELERLTESQTFMRFRELDGTMVDLSGPYPGAGDAAAARRGFGGMIDEDGLGYLYGSVRQS